MQFYYKFGLALSLLVIVISAIWIGMVYFGPTMQAEGATQGVFGAYGLGFVFLAIGIIGLIVSLVKPYKS